MAILGSAEVIIRAITTHLKKDIKDGLDSAAADVSASGDEQGKAYAAHFADSVENDLQNALGDKISAAISAAYDEGRGDRDGRSMGLKLAAGFGRALTGAFGMVASFTALSTMVVGLTGLIGGLVGALGSLAAGAVAITAALGPAMAAIGIVGVASLGAFAGVAGVAIGLFHQLKGEVSTLGPAATQVRAEWALLKIDFDRVFKAVGESKVFPQLAAVLSTLRDELFPTLRGAIEGFAGAIGNTLSKLNQLFESPVFQGAFATAIDAMVGLADSFGSVLVDLVGVFVDLIAAAKPAIDMFAAWFRSWAANLHTITDAGLATGKLGDFFTNAAAKGAQFFDILGNLWNILKNVFRAASPLGAVFLDSFQRGTQALSDFLDTAEGSQKLFDFFKPGGQVHQNLSAIWGLVKELGSSVASLAQNRGIESLAKGITAVLPSVTTLVNEAIIAVGGFAAALGRALNTPIGQKGVEALRQGIEDLGGAFAALAPAIGPLLQIIGDLVSNLSDLLGPAFRAIAAILPDLVGPLDRVGAALGQVLLAAVKAIAPLLPPLAEIFATIAEALAGPLSSAIQTAGTYLRLLLDILGPVVNILSLFAPALTAVAVGFVAFKIVGQISTGLGILSRALLTAADSGGAMSGVLGRVGQGLGALSGLAAGAAVGIGLAIAGYEAYNQLVTASADLTNQLGQAFAQGGFEAKKAAEGLAAFRSLLIDGQGATANFADQIRSAVVNFSLFGHSLADFIPTQKEADAASKEYLATLSPLDQATQRVTTAQNNLEMAVGQTGTASKETAAAHKELEAAEAAAEAQQRMLDQATQSYADKLKIATQAIYDNINAELSRSNADLAAQSAILSVADAQDRYTQAVAQYGPESRQAQQAQIAFQQAQNNAIATAERAAQAIADNIIGNKKYGTATEQANAATAAQIEYLKGLAATAQGDVKVQLEAMIKKLEEAGAIDAKPKVTVEGAEDAKTKADDVKTKLDDLSKVDAKAKLNLDASAFAGVATGAEISLKAFEKRVATAKADLNIGPFNTAASIVDALIAALTGRTAKPKADLDSKAFDKLLAISNNGLSTFEQRIAVPHATLDPSVFNSLLSNSNNVFTAFANRIAVPQAHLAPNVFNALLGAANGALSAFGVRIATPQAHLNSSVFNTVSTAVNSTLTSIGARVVAPTVSVIDRASGVLRGIISLLGSIVSKTVNVVTNFITGGKAGGGLVNESMWTTVGEEGREMVFLSQGQYVATYQKAQRILAAAATQTSGFAAQAASVGRPVEIATVASGGGAGVVIPITVNPSANMDEAELARMTGREFAWRFGR